MTLGEKVAEIRKLGEAQGDRGLLQAREAAYTLLGGGHPRVGCQPGDAPPVGAGRLAGGGPRGPAAVEGAKAEVAGEAG